MHICFIIHNYFSVVTITFFNTMTAMTPPVGTTHEHILKNYRIQQCVSSLDIVKFEETKAYKCLISRDTGIQYLTDHGVRCQAPDQVSYIIRWACVLSTCLTSILHGFHDGVFVTLYRYQFLLMLCDEWYHFYRYYFLFCNLYHFFFACFSISISQPQF